MDRNQLKLVFIHKKKLEQNTKFLLSFVSSSQASIKRRRRHYKLEILRLWKKRKALISLIENRIRPRNMWTKIRTSTFWEREVLANNDDYFKQHFRMTRQTFNILCSELKNLDLRDTNFRRCIPLEKRIAIAVYTLGSSAEYRTVSAIFGVGISSVCKIVKTFCEEVWRVLKPKVLCAYPLNEENIKENVKGFEKLGFPQCFGAIDGCHIEIKPPAQDAVDYYNYKGWYSTVLLAVVDYRFLYISVGSPGRCNDSQIYENSYVREQHRQPILNSMSKKICGEDVPVVLIGDSAFRFSESLMKPFPFDINASLEEKNFNYALSKCRRVVENCFGHLKARFRRIGKGLDNRIENSNSIIKACCVLHNFLNIHNDEINTQWLQITNNNTHREQPNHSTQIDDVLSTPSIIRNAISMHLAGLGFEEVEAEERSVYDASVSSYLDEEYLLDVGSPEVGSESAEN